MAGNCDRRLGLALLLVLVAGAACGTRLDPAKPAGMSGGNADFSFAVLADVQEPPLFTAEIGWLSTFKVDFFAIAGDHTPGYLADRAGQAAFWRGFEVTADRLPAPYVMVPGNHDTYNADAESLWRERYGPLWFSWDHQGCHFIALDSAEPGKGGVIGQQLEWLKKDLAGAKGARAIFVFIHHPLWFPNYKSKEWFADVHPLLAKAGVNYVFCGHEHHYVLCEKRDGVQYVMLGPTAGLTGGSFSSFINALLVQVRGNAVSYRLMTPEGERPADFYTREMDLRAVKPLECEPLGTIGKNRPVELVVDVSNPSNDRPVQAIVTLKSGTGSWKAARVERTVGAGKRERITIKTGTGGSILPIPTVSLEMRCSGELVAVKESLPVITARIPGLTERLVDDFNDGDDVNACDRSQISLGSGRWYQSADQYGSSRMAMVFTDGALHVTGIKGKSVAPNYTFTNFHTKLASGGRLNLTGSAGISFRARSDKGSRWEAGLEAIVGGKNLGGSGRGHRVTFEAGKDWKEYRLSWSQFSQPDWVTPPDRVSPVTVDAVEGLSWNQPAEGVEFDLWLDDVKLTYE